MDLSIVDDDEVKKFGSASIYMLKSKRQMNSECFIYIRSSHFFNYQFFITHSLAFDKFTFVFSIICPFIVFR